MIFRSRQRFNAVRFASYLAKKGFERLPAGRRKVPAGKFYIRTYRRECGRPWYGVVYTKQMNRKCSTPGHEQRPAKANLLCDSCWHRDKYARDEKHRERKRASARRWYASLTPAQKAARQRKARVRNKLRRWAA